MASFHSRILQVALLAVSLISVVLSLIVVALVKLQSHRIDGLVRDTSFPLLLPSVSTFDFLIAQLEWAQRLLDASVRAGVDLPPGLTSGLRQVAQAVRRQRHHPGLPLGQLHSQLRLPPVHPGVSAGLRRLPQARQVRPRPYSVYEL